MTKDIERLTRTLSSLAKTEEDRVWVTRVVEALNHRYDLSAKLVKEPGLEEIIQQLLGRIVTAFNGFSAVKDKKVLDIACGSNTSKAPSMIYVNTPFGERNIKIPGVKGYTAQFEPWFCRILLELGADPTGVDIGDLEDEAFTHYKVDLGLRGGLDFLPSHSFDAVQDSRLFGSPEFTAQFPNPADRLETAAEITLQERRLLKTGGIVIHSDAGDLVNHLH